MEDEDYDVLVKGVDYHYTVRGGKDTLARVRRAIVEGCFWTL